MINSLAHIKSRLHMRHLRLLSALSEEGSVRRTAEKLAITQPAATKILQEIEELLGQKMFVRTTNGLQPNGLGEAAIRYARLVFADLDSFHEEILAIESGHRGGCVSVRSARWRVASYRKPSHRSRLIIRC